MSVKRGVRRATLDAPRPVPAYVPAAPGVPAELPPTPPLPSTEAAAPQRPAGHVDARFELWEQAKVEARDPRLPEPARSLSQLQVLLLASRMREKRAQLAVELHRLRYGIATDPKRTENRVRELNLDIVALELELNSGVSHCACCLMRHPEHAKVPVPDRELLPG